MFSRDVLSIKSFRNLWLGQAISQLGDALYYLAFMYMAKHVSGRADVVGYVGAMEALPFLLVGPYAGVLADRIDRRRIMLLSDFLCAGLLVSFAGFVFMFGGKPPVWSLLVVPFFLSSMRCVFMPAKSAAIPMLVPREKLLRANALSASTFNIVYVLGLSLAALVVGQLFAVSPQWFFVATLMINATSFLLSGLFISRLPSLLPDRDDAHERHPFEDFKAGLRFVRQRHDLKMFMALITAFRFCVAPFMVVYIEANERWFDGKPQTLSWMELAFFFGMILGSVAIARVRVERPTRFLMLGLALVGLTVAAMGFSPVLWLFMFWNLIAGIAVPFADIPVLTYLQTSVEDAFRGRVNALREMIASGIMPIGMVFAGGFVQLVGLQAAFLLMGGGMMVATLAGMADPRFRNVRLQVRSEQEQVAPIAQVA